MTSAVSEAKNRPGSKLTIVLAASEVVGFAKTGGLADVVGSLPPVLEQHGHQCAVFLPLYRCTKNASQPVEPTDHEFEVVLGYERRTARLWKSTLPDSQVPVYLIQEDWYFARDNQEVSHGLYQYLSTDGNKRDYPDNCQRFAFFSKAVLEALRVLDLWPDVLHVNDWQTSLIPVYLDQIYSRSSSTSLREKYRRVRVLLTIHNMAYQGVFGAEMMPVIGLDWSLFNHLQLEFYNFLNFLKGGIVFSHLLNTVSPTYAREIQTREGGWGLEGALQERSDRLFGIVNGVNYQQWDPATDKKIAANYTAKRFSESKALCKAELQRQFGLPENPQAPLIGMVARLVDQKGPQLLIPIVPALVSMGCQLAILGDGQQNYHDALEGLESRFPGQMGVKLGFDDTFAHHIEAGADIFVMPSLYEPSGLNQLYSLKYGTVPVVRATGGLADTVTDCTTETLLNRSATGFRFESIEPEALLHALTRAIYCYRTEPETWKQLIETGMNQDWSWSRSATEYEQLYHRLKSKPLT